MLNETLINCYCRYERFVFALEEASRDVLAVLKDKALKVCCPSPDMYSGCSVVLLLTDHVLSRFCECYFCFPSSIYCLLRF